jgi:hypothetical protein
LQEQKEEMFARQINKLPKSSTVSDVRQIDIYTPEPLVPEPSPFEVEIAIENLNRCKWPDIDQIPAGVIQSGGET